MDSFKKGRKGGIREGCMLIEGMRDKGRMHDKRIRAGVLSGHTVCYVYLRGAHVNLHTAAVQGGLGQAFACCVRGRVQALTRPAKQILLPCIGLGGRKIKNKLQCHYCNKLKTEMNSVLLVVDLLTSSVYCTACPIKVGK